MKLIVQLGCRFGCSSNYFGRTSYGSKKFLRIIPTFKENLSLLTLEDKKCFGTKRRSLKNTLRENAEKLRLVEPKITKKGRIILDNLNAAKTTFRAKMEAVIERENIWTIPNILTCTRIAVSPYLGYLLCNGNFHLAFSILFLAGITDLLDGIIARNFPSQASKLGSFLDPLADKVLIATMCLTLTYVDLMPVFLTAIILTRDIALTTAGFYIRYQSLPPPKTLARYFDPTHATAKLAPTNISKFNTSVQLAAVGISLMSPIFEVTGHPYLQYLWYITATTTMVSALSYVYSKNTYKIIKKKK